MSSYLTHPKKKFKNLNKKNLQSINNQNESMELAFIYNVFKSSRGKTFFKHF